ncbi:MAG: UDP-N-acetylmuramoyl-L-alanyl-D-glutamate--2,6-diaminopimelate ligase [Clostridiales Family XIII bacterium]|jgi:UDP-N-acetylmuramoyl-L-alanyl-D-glutamate--2,6-diaminopimelate ligase|nr:UDP-N-acetylmuramoyl-L-alanyl-D-glutamate--2,6-diaminopimelate ligase [Clostridiales Family XIII bacterium]
MRLDELFDGIEYGFIQGDMDVDVTDISIDSRLTEKGDLFVATVGASADGHDYIEQAISRGAVAALIQSDRSERLPLSFPNGAPQDFTILSVPDTREILSALVNRLCGDPARKFRLIGITGTNGKTSVAAMLDHILRFADHKTGLLGTIDNYCGGEALRVRRTTPTTPDCVELGHIMSQMAEANVDDLIMEVSSMGLKTGRVNALTFDVGVFTNLSPEHLDDHKTMEDYRASKLKLFPLSEYAVVNLDDPFSAVVRKNARGEVLGYAIKNKEGSGLFAENISYTGDGVSFDMVYELEESAERVSLGTPGEFAIYNALAATGAALRLGVAFPQIAAALREKIDIPGRFEVIRSGGISAIVDYAHTAEALENLLTAVRGNPRYSRIISVFGCGGDRDPGKRAPMGRISGRLADYTVITSDNPRTEDALAIIDGIVAGIQNSGGDYEVELDRQKAIEKAIAGATPGTAVVISGKGHEDYQIIGHEKIHFDDREIVRTVFERIGGVES